MGTEVNMIRKCKCGHKEMKININICEVELTQLVIDCTEHEGKGQNQG